MEQSLVDALRYRLILKKLAVDLERALASDKATK